MRKIGYVLVVTALASSAALAQQAGSQASGQAGAQTSGQVSAQSGSAGAQQSGTERPRGVVTGGKGDGGIALQSDRANAQGSVPAVSGGVSLNARDNLRSQTPPHNVKMVFALNTGNYVSDVQVRVTDRSGRVVLEDVSNGPWLFAQLPPGSYTATATYNGAPVTHRFTVGKSGVRTAQFRWPASVEGRSVASAGEGGGQILGTGPQEPQQR